MRFENPIFLILLLVIPVLIYLNRGKKSVFNTVLFSDISALKDIECVKSKYIEKTLYFLRYIILILIIVVLARPQAVMTEKEVFTEGIDILMALDVSGSMSAEDFKPDNRLVVAKQTIQDFIKKRTSDRIGLVVFGGDAFTQCPLTMDYDVLKTFLSRVELEMAGDGTAIGLSIATALNRIKDQKSKTKIIILLTDGVNNKGEIDPITAAELAEKLGIKIYTIGVGKEGGAPIPIDDPQYGRVYARNPDGSLLLTEIDENTLMRISEITGGKYFRATDASTLKDIYKAIDQLEKTKIKTKQFEVVTDYFQFFLWVIFGLLLFDILVSRIFWRISP